ncbi:MAG: preprotein translocase subunit SecY [Calditrichaeota bacterium]|nr:MAG: preprotein translocase subunit SecY [Calditrichota bacterium]MBL1205004.1 preprotein translocase subunit SecY [Calditrichota bacterium]
MILESFRNIFKIADLRKRVLFTVMILGIERIGTHIVTPGIDTAVLAEGFRNLQGTLFGLYDLFAGGAFKKAAIFGLGIMPYISASIIIQLLGAVFPYFQKLQKEGDEGRKKITQFTRYGTLAISAAQAAGVAFFLQSIQVADGRLAVPDPGLGFVLMTVLSMTSGTMLIMWLGEQIDDRGIGNGISLIIFIGIIAQLPSALIQEFEQFSSGQRHLLEEVALMALAFAIIYVVVLLTQGTRKIPVQYAKRVVGRKVYGGVNTHFPMKVLTAGVMPIIFAQALMFVPQTMITFLPESDFTVYIQGLFSYDSWFYWIFYFVVIVFFTYFYTAIALNPVDVADNLKKQGGFIPGVRPGKKTSEFLDNILTRITLPASIFLGLIAIVPMMLAQWFNIPFSLASFFGGTGLLIIVGVALDFLQQIESQLFERHYDGFMKSGAIKSRRA